MPVFKPEVDPEDTKDIQKIIETYFVQQPRNIDGSARQQGVFSTKESEALVNKVLSELGRRGYAIMKPKEVSSDDLP